jgi:hypothetical protein
LRLAFLIRFTVISEALNYDMFFAIPSNSADIFS